MYLISSCLVGVSCRYNGTCTLNLDLKKMVDEGNAIAVCPEILAGMSTPRESCEIQRSNGKTMVVSKSGSDCTHLFEKAAIETLKICKTRNIQKAVLQSRSPSCGFGKIYDGTFSGRIIKGNGLTADLLCNNGIEIFTDENFGK